MHTDIDRQTNKTKTIAERDNQRTLNSSSPISSTDDCRMRHASLVTPSSTAGSSSGRLLWAYVSTMVRPVVRSHGDACYATVAAK